jgi:hypothetical protein
MHSQGQTQGNTLLISAYASTALSTNTVGVCCFLPLSRPFLQATQPMADEDSDEDNESGTPLVQRQYY